MEEGQKYFFTKHIAKKDISVFARLSQDFNPVHTKRGFLEKSPLGKVLKIGKEEEKKVIAHGLLSVSLINHVLFEAGGPGTIFVELGEIRFLKPVWEGDTITVELKIDAIVATEQKDRVICSVSWRNQRNEAIISPTQAMFLVYKQMESQKGGDN